MLSSGPQVSPASKYVSAGGAFTRTLVEGGRLKRQRRRRFFVVHDVVRESVGRHDDCQPAVRQQPENSQAVLGHAEVSSCNQSRKK